MKIIVEGPDGSGKSTLAEALGKALDLPVIHAGGPIATAGEFFNRLGDKGYFNDKSAIFDRFPIISEYVYGDPPVLDPGILTLSLAIFSKPGIKFIYCRGPVEEMKAAMIRSNKRHKPPEWYAKVDKRYLQIIHRYDKLFYGMDPIRYNRWEDPTVKGVLKCVALSS